ncbi:MAG: type II secretion system protein [Planctomycetota bacterium]|nr:type II secretion system protein [Planctomycetota bacterium]
MNDRHSETDPVSPEQSLRGCRFDVSSTRSIRGFSMIELIVVLSVIVLLTSILFPGLQVARDGARRVICSANQRQIGVAFMLFGSDQNGRLPQSWFQDQGQLPNMMAMTTGSSEDQAMPAGFDGLGLLWKDRYIDSPACCFCPAHASKHTFEATRSKLVSGTDADPAFCNYHYTGHLTHGDPNRRMRRRLSDPNLVLLTDGLRSREDFNHQHGLNILRSDGSTIFRADTGSVFRDSLPESDEFNGDVIEEMAAGEWIAKIWMEIKIDG